MSDDHQDVNLCDQRAAMRVLFSERDRTGVGNKELRDRSRVAINSAQYWLAGKAAPTLGRLVSFAAALGYSVILVKTPGGGGTDDEINLSDQRSALDRLFAERTRIGMSIFDLEARSGISVNTMYAWRAEKREPALGNLVALANVLGFEIVLRKSFT